MEVNVDRGQRAASRFRLAARAAAIMEADLAAECRLKRLSETLGVSQATLSAAFREVTNQSPHRWLVERRLEYARTLLGDTSRCVTSIALDCGFCSSQHFATAFRQHFGITPSAYRREVL